jgi:hypothetical protein
MTTWMSRQHTSYVRTALRLHNRGPRRDSSRASNRPDPTTSNRERRTEQRTHLHTVESPCEDSSSVANICWHTGFDLSPHPAHMSLLCCIRGSSSAWELWRMASEGEQCEGD